MRGTLHSHGAGCPLGAHVVIDKLDDRLQPVGLADPLHAKLRRRLAANEEKRTHGSKKEPRELARTAGTESLSSTSVWTVLAQQAVQQLDEEEALSH